MASASVTERKRNNCVSHNASGARETAAEQPSLKRPDFRVCELPVLQNCGRLRGELPVLQNRGRLGSEQPVLQNRGKRRSELPVSRKAAEGWEANFRYCAEPQKAEKRTAGIAHGRGRWRREFTELWERRKGKTA